MFKRSVLLVAFAGEEMGMVGSNSFLNNPPVSLSSIVAMINLDMIGRNRDSPVYVMDAYSSPDFYTLDRGS